MKTDIASQQLEWRLNDFAIRCFRYTADHDYVGARIAFRANLWGTFQWLGLHALEKYLKCILLLNRIEAKDVKHFLSKGLAKLAEIDQPEVILSDDVKATFAYFEAYGFARYLEKSHMVDGRKLPELDRAAWEIRRYCRPFRYDLELGPNRTQGDFTEAQVARASDTPHEYRIPGGELERIVQGRDTFQRRGLIWHNAFFGLRARKEVTFEVLRIENSPLSLSPEIVDEVSRFVYLPDRLIQAYRDLAEEQRAAARPSDSA